MNQLLQQNILAQPEALRQIAAYQFGAGRDALLRSAELLRGSKRVVLSGMGASLFACFPLSYMLAERGVMASVIETSELLYFLSSMVDAETAVILVSRSGESVEVTKLLPLLSGRCRGVIGVVNVPESTLARQARETLVVNSPPDQLVAIQTYSGTLAALALLDAAYGGELESRKDEVASVTSTLAQILSDCLRADWGDFIAKESPLYLLGRGPALASVNAGALLMHEVAKMPAVGMSSAQFRHGPVEVVSEGFRAVVFGSAQTALELDLTLAEDLTRIGGAIRWVGRLHRESNVTPLSSWKENVPQRFSSLLEVVPLQLLAYQTAERRGVLSEQFRFAPAITLSETGFLGSA